jgi:DNA-directed RNA polymerase I, II, and III subunit RPABC2
MEDKEDYEYDIEENAEKTKDENDENDSLLDENESEEEEEYEEEEDIDETHEENFNEEKEQSREISGFIDNDIEDESEDDSDEDENYLQKFEENINKTIIQDSHPELHCHNYKEVEAMCRVVRDANGNIVDPLHTTIPFVTRYEKARIIGERAKQINAGGSLFIDVEPNVIDGYLIALEEFNQKKIPFIIQRPLPNGGCEYWRLKDLDVL